MLDDAFSVALLHMDGADASTTFTDESGKTWTPTGQVQIDTAQSVFGGASALFDGAGDYITSADHADWRLDSGSNSNAWTIDFRVRFNGDPGTATMGLISQRVDASNGWTLMLDNNALVFYAESANVAYLNISNAWNPAGDTWYHVACVKQGTTGYKMFINGTQIGSTQTDTSPLEDLAAGLDIGRYGANYFNGWMDEVRISKGVARWTSNFTPPTEAYAPAVSSSAFFAMF